MTSTMIDDRELYEVHLSPICTFCGHFKPENWRRCAAFPDSIPDEIWNGVNDHTTPYPGDHGIRFEKLPGPA